MRVLIACFVAWSCALHGADSKPLVDVLRDYHTSSEKQDGWSELAYAIKNGYVDAADKMIRNGVSPDQLPDDESHTPFIVAIQCGYPQLVQRMVDYKANINKPVKNIYDTCMPQMVTDHYPKRTCGPDTYSPLMVAIQSHQPEIAAILLENGADPAYSSYLRYQPIHLAVRHQQVDTLRLLLDKGVDVNTKDMWGYAPLHYCAFLPDSPTVAKLGSLLLERGADANMQTGSGHYRLAPLHLSALNGHGDLVQLLLARRAEVDGEDSQGATPLWRAAGSGTENRDAVRGLILARADINKLNTSAAAQNPASNLGTGILGIAIASGNLDTAELLLENGADVNIVDIYGKTPLMYAVSNNDLDAVKLLLSYRADPNKPGNINRTSMDIAHNLQHKEVFELLVNAHAEQLYK